jgi:hypothetical protein
MGISGLAAFVFPGVGVDFVFGVAHGLGSGDAGRCVALVVAGRAGWGEREKKKKKDSGSCRGIGCAVGYVAFEDLALLEGASAS